MSEPIVAISDEAAIPIRLVTSAAAEAEVAALSPPLRAQAKLAKFAGKPGEVVVLTSGEGPAEVLAGLGDGASVMALRALPAKLPAGFYALAPGEGPPPADVALAFALGHYRFDRYRREARDAGARLVAPPGVDLDELHAVAHACALARDM